jgi:hypothetical protein
LQQLQTGLLQQLRQQAATGDGSQRLDLQSKNIPRLQGQVIYVVVSP